MSVMCARRAAPLWLCLAGLAGASATTADVEALVPGTHTSPVTRPATSAAEPLAPLQRLYHGRFKSLHMYVPAGAVHTVVLLLSDESGWTASTDDLAQQLRRQGALVAGIDWHVLRASLEADGADCMFPDGDLENLSHFVQAYYHLPTYLPPVLLGERAGGTLAYASLAQSPKDTFAGALSIDFCPTIKLRKPLCKGTGLSSRAKGPRMEFLPATHLADPWIDLATQSAARCPSAEVDRFVAQVPGAARVVTRRPAPGQDWPELTGALSRLAREAPAKPVALPPAVLGDLPVIEVPAAAGTASGDRFALILSGDGGWAGLDEEVAGALSARGIPVVGLDSLRYFWTARTPEGMAADADRIIRYYLAKLAKSKVLLIGYSQGADVLPFAVNRLPPATREHVALAVLLGMSEHALFEFHLSSWVSDDDTGPATLPEVNRISGTPLLCVYGADEDDSLCPRLDSRRFKVVQVKGGHHFNGDYAGLARVILAAATP